MDRTCMLSPLTSCMGALGATGGAAFPIPSARATRAHTCAKAATRQPVGGKVFSQGPKAYHHRQQLACAANRDASSDHTVQRSGARQQRQHNPGSPLAGASQWQRFAFFIHEGNPKEAWLSIRCGSSTVARHRQLQLQARLTTLP